MIGLILTYTKPSQKWKSHCSVRQKMTEVVSVKDSPFRILALNDYWFYIFYISDFWLENLVACFTCFIMTLFTGVLWLDQLFAEFKLWEFVYECILGWLYVYKLQNVFFIFITWVVDYRRITASWYRLLCFGQFLTKYITKRYSYQVKQFCSQSGPEMKNMTIVSCMQTFLWFHPRVNRNKREIFSWFLYSEGKQISQK